MVIDTDLCPAFKEYISSRLETRDLSTVYSLAYVLIFYNTVLFRTVSFVEEHKKIRC